MKSLKEKYTEICNQYIMAFVDKHEYKFDYWIAGEVGGLASFIEQYVFSMDDIRYDIDTNQPTNLIFIWQDDSVDNTDIKINFKAYSNGLRYEYVRLKETEETIDNLKKAIEQAQEMLNKNIKEFKFKTLQHETL